MADNTDDPEHVDAFLRGARNVPAQHILEAMSDIELAEEQTKFSNEKPGLVIIQNEWRRREKFYQHQLNLEILKAQSELNKNLVASQNRTMLVAASIGALFAIIAAFITVNASSKPNASQVPNITISIARGQAITLSTPEQNLQPISPTQKVPAEAPSVKQ